MWRTASIRTQVGPAVTRIRRPDRLVLRLCIGWRLDQIGRRSPWGIVSRGIRRSKAARGWRGYGNRRVSVPVDISMSILLRPGQSPRAICGSLTRLSVARIGLGSMSAIKELLAEVPLFEGLSEVELNLVAARVRQLHRKEGANIFHRNDPGVALYIIVSGKVKIHNETNDGGDHIITILGDGEFFGELAVLDGEERSADATTLAPTELLMLTRDDLHDIIRRNPSISLVLLETLAGRLRRTTEIYLAYSELDVNGRLALQLLRLAEQNGIVGTNGIRIDLKLTQTDLGALVGASRESVNKVMGFLKRQGHISVDERGQITIRNVGALKKISDTHNYAADSRRSGRASEMRDSRNPLSPASIEIGVASLGSTQVCPSRVFCRIHAEMIWTSSRSAELSAIPSTPPAAP